MMTHPRRFLPVLVVLLGLSWPGPDGRTATASRPYLDTAIDAARWIRSTAIKTEHGTVWPADPTDPKSVNPLLYSGTPGVVLFFLEMHRATGKTDYLAEARAGADHLLANLDAPMNAGLYTGLAGVGFTLTEVHKATRDAKYREGARRVVSMLHAKAKRDGEGVEWSEVTDIIGGSAGPGLFLLSPRPGSWGRPRRSNLAVRAGRRLLELSQPEAGGRKWAMSPKQPRLMPNFSHGTAGIAYFLASLYQETKDRAFLEGALAGAKYIQAVAKTDGDVCLVFHHEPEEDGKNLFYLGLVPWTGRHGALVVSAVAGHRRRRVARLDEEVGARPSHERNPRETDTGLLEQREPVLRLGRRGRVLPGAAPRDQGPRVPGILAADDRAISSTRRRATRRARGGCRPRRACSPTRSLRRPAGCRVPRGSAPGWCDWTASIRADTGRFGSPTHPSKAFFTEVWLVDNTPIVSQASRGDRGRRAVDCPARRAIGAAPPA